MKQTKYQGAYCKKCKFAYFISVFTEIKNYVRKSASIHLTVYFLTLEQTCVLIGQSLVASLMWKELIYIFIHHSKNMLSRTSEMKRIRISLSITLGLSISISIILTCPSRGSSGPLTAPKTLWCDGAWTVIVWKVFTFLMWYIFLNFNLYNGMFVQISVI